MKNETIILMFIFIFGVIFSVGIFAGRTTLIQNAKKIGVITNIVDKKTGASELFWLTGGTNLVKY